MAEQYLPIHVATLEGWLRQEAWRREWIEKNRPEVEVRSHDERIAKQRADREALASQFPFAVVLEGASPEHDLVSRWCWQHVGPPQCERCLDSHSEYPGCPLVVATGKQVSTSWQDRSGVTRTGHYMKYGEVEEHDHEGTWRTFWWGKTGYDYGVGEFLFSSQADLDRLVAALPEIREQEL